MFLLIFIFYLNSNNGACKFQQKNKKRNNKKNMNIIIFLNFKCYDFKYSKIFIYASFRLLKI